MENIERQMETGSMLRLTGTTWIRLGLIGSTKQPVIK